MRMMLIQKYYRLILAAVLIVSLSPTPLHASQKIQMIGNFSAHDVRGWKQKVFHNKTLYEITKSDQGSVLHADSRSSASAFYKDVHIDLTQTPCLHWSWKVDHVLEGLQENTKSGDDFAARVYVVFSGGVQFWNTRALNYVWAGNSDIGTAWPSAYTNQSINIAIQSGPSLTKHWIHEHRNIVLDAQDHFGKSLKSADGIAIMVDTDNSKTAATATFGDIYVSKSC